MAKDKVPTVVFSGLRSDGTPFIPLTEKEFINRRRSIGKAIETLPEFKKEIAECLEKVPLTEKEILDRRYGFCKGFDKILPELKKEVAESPIGEIKVKIKDIEQKMVPEFDLYLKSRSPEMEAAMRDNLMFNLWDEDFVAEGTKIDSERGLIIRSEIHGGRPLSKRIKWTSCKEVREK